MHHQTHTGQFLRPFRYWFALLASSSDNDLSKNGGAFKPVGDSSRENGMSLTAEAANLDAAAAAGAAAAAANPTPGGSANGAGSKITPSSPARTVLAHEDPPESTAAYGAAAEVDFDRARAAPPVALARRLLRMGKPGARDKPPRERARFAPPLKFLPVPFPSAAAASMPALAGTPLPLPLLLAPTAAAAAPGCCSWWFLGRRRGIDQRCCGVSRRAVSSLKLEAPEDPLRTTSTEADFPRLFPVLLLLLMLLLLALGNNPPPAPTPPPTPNPNALS